MRQLVITRPHQLYAWEMVMLSHTQNAVRWLALSIKSVEAPQKYHLFVQLSFDYHWYIKVTVIAICTNACK